MTALLPLVVFLISLTVAAGWFLRAVLTADDFPTITRSRRQLAALDPKDRTR